MGNVDWTHARVGEHASRECTVSNEDSLVFRPDIGSPLRYIYRKGEGMLRVTVTTQSDKFTLTKWKLGVTT